MTVTSADFRELIDRYKNDPLLFVRQVIKPKIISNDQESFLRAVGDACKGKGKPYISVVSGTGTGKTATLAWLVLWAVAPHPSAKIPCTATTYTQVQTLLWPECMRWQAQMNLAFRSAIDIASTKIKQNGNEECFAVIKAAVANNPQAFQGVHAPFVMFIFDEASGIPQSIFDAAEGSCSHAGSVGLEGQALFICTGNGNLASGPFYDSHHKNRSGWRCLSFSSRNSPFCGADYIARQEAIYGKDSNQVRIRINGQFPKDDPDTLIHHDWAEEAKMRDICEALTTTRVAGLDPKGSGSDSIGFVIRQGQIAYRPEEWNPAWEEAQIIGHTMKLWKERVFDELNVDCIGIGSAICSVLEEQGVPVRRVNVSTPPIFHPELNNHLRDDLWWEAREWLRLRNCRLHAGTTPDSEPTPAQTEYLEKLIHELTVPKYAPNSSGKNVVEAKKDLKKADRLGHSPGLADALCLTFATRLPITRTNRAFLREAHRRARQAGADAWWDA